MQAREADATITAVLGHPPEEIAQTFQDPSFGSQPQAVRVPCGAPWDLLVALHHTKPEKGRPCFYVLDSNRPVPMR